MKNLIYDNWVKPLQALLAAAALTFGAVNLNAGEAVAAPSRNPVIRRQIKSLKESNRRWIQVDLSEQRLTAWEGDTPIKRFNVSTGRRGKATPPGIFRIQTKLRRARMRGPGYDFANVPYTMYYDGDFGIHGAYWHNRFGAPVSRGCVNLRPASARRLYNWARVGTSVVVHR